MLLQTSLGIDIGNRSVAFAYLKASFKGVRLAAHAIYPLEEEIPLKEKVDRIGGLVRDFIGKRGVSPATVFLGFPRHMAIVRYVQLPLAVKENLRETLAYEMEKYVPLSLDEIYFDYQIVMEDKAAGRLKLLLVAVKRKTVDMHLDLALQIGVGVSGIEITSTAIANYFSSQQDANGIRPDIIVFLRNGHLELDGTRAGYLDYSRSIATGEWEKDLHGWLSRELERQKEDRAEGQESLRAIFCGFDRVPELLDSLRGYGDVDIHLVDLSRRGLPSPDLIPAYGLALKGIRTQQTDINLAPRERRKRPSKVAYYAMVVLAGLLVALALAWGGGNIISQQLYLRRLNVEIARLAVEVQRIEETKTRCEALEKRIDTLTRLFRGGAPVMNIFKELSEKIPKTAWVTSVAYSDGEVKLEGRADASSELIPPLEASPLFNDVAFISSITRGHAGKEVFRIGFKVTK